MIFNQTLWLLALEKAFSPERILPTVYSHKCLALPALLA
jgi:hypothetical protein